MQLHKFLIFPIFVLFSFPAYSQLTVNPNQTAVVLSSTLAGPGVVILSPTLTCPGVANGTFTASGTLLGMASGILLTNGHAAACAGPYGPPPGTASFNDGAPGDPAMLALLPAGATTYDACILEFDVVAGSDSIAFNYQFGSQEYYSAVCSRYDDAFAFFISGPGIAGTPDMALVPGTSIPVEINSVNDGIPGPSGGVLSNCTSLGAGSPFTSYYIDNTGGTLLSYKGYTQKFRAAHLVTPCDTYHLKLSIVDAGNAIYDSGVFLEAASLTTNGLTFKRSDSTGAYLEGYDHAIVKGCNPASLTVVTTYTLSTTEMIHYRYGGTAVKGVDFLAPDSTLLSAGADSISFTIRGLPTPSAGPKTVVVYLYAPSGCSFADSITLTLLDTPHAAIITPDTIICPTQSVLIQVSATPGLTFSWAPAASLSGATLMTPVATPTVATTYTMTATLPGSGCPPMTGEISIRMDSVSVNLLTPDTSICSGQKVFIRVSGPDSLHYSWSPASGLDSTHIKDPVAIPDSNTTYVLTASSGAGCTVTRSFSVNLLHINVSLYNPDTAICRGASVHVNATGDAGVSYQWLPTAGIPNSTIINPTITPDTSAWYYLTGSLPGCHETLDSIKIDVQPNPSVYIGGNRSVCTGDTIHIHAWVNPAWYTHYHFHWAPGTDLDDTTASVVVFRAGDSTHIGLRVSTPAGCAAVDSAFIDVHSIAQDSIGNFTICPGDSIHLLPVKGMTAYYWTPGMYLSDSTSGAPWVHAITNETYRLIEYNSFGCRDTLFVKVTVQPAAVIDLGDSVVLSLGGSYQVSAQTNCTSFLWTPPAGLDHADVSNPVASPLISTRYFVRATTSWGCSVNDSLDVFVNTDAILALPNAFTPGAGVNSLFRIIRNGNATLNFFRIYNRWGNLVFETTDIEKGWDGAYNGTPQPFGVFVYVVEATTSTGNVFRKQGNVTLIR